MQQAAQEAARRADQVTQKVTEAAVSRDVLVQKRDEIKTQLSELTERRRELQSQMDQMNPVTARGHQARIAVIDQRSAALETELFAINDQLAGLPADGSFEYSTTQQPDVTSEIRNAVDDAVFGAFAASVFSLMGVWVLWRGFRRFVWKRKPQAVSDNSAQLMQLQQSVDTMAIEIERISEAQRFAAKLLNDRVLSQGEAQPVAVHQRESAGARKRP